MLLILKDLLIAMLFTFIIFPGLGEETNEGAEWGFRSIFTGQSNVHSNQWQTPDRMSEGRWSQNESFLKRLHLVYKIVIFHLGAPELTRLQIQDLYSDYIVSKFQYNPLVTINFCYLLNISCDLWKITYLRCIQYLLLIINFWFFSFQYDIRQKALKLTANRYK